MKSWGALSVDRNLPNNNSTSTDHAAHPRIFCPKNIIVPKESTKESTQLKRWLFGKLVEHFLHQLNQFQISSNKKNPAKNARHQPTTQPTPTHPPKKTEQTTHHGPPKSVPPP